MKLPDDAKINTWLKISLLVLSIFLCIVVFADKVVPILGRFMDIAVPIILPFALGAVIAVLLEPIIEFFQNRLRMGRKYSVFAVLFIIIALIVGLLAWGIYRLIREISSFISDFSAITRTTEDVINYATDFYNTYLSDIIDIAVFEEWTANASEHLVSAGSWLADWTVGFVASVPTILIIVLLTIVATYFFCRSKNSAGRALAKFFPAKYRDKVVIVWDKTSAAFSGYVRALIILMLITMTLSIIGLLIVQSEYAVTLGILTGILDIIPILGPSAVLVPLAVYCYIKGSLGTAIGVLIVYAIVTLVRNLAQPFLVADNLDLHPLLTFFALFAGLLLWGFAGMILLPILAVVIQAIIKSAKES